MRRLLPIEQWSVDWFEKNRLPADVDPACPACEGSHRSIEYRTARAVRLNNGGSMDASSFGGPEDPHLKITCSHCGFWWEREVARA